MAKRHRYSISEDHLGYKVPLTDFTGIYPSHHRKDGTTVWRAQIFEYSTGFRKLKVIGYFTEELSAARAYDAYVREHNISATINFDEFGNRLKHLGSHLSLEEEKVVHSLCGIIPSSKIAEIINVSTKLVNQYMRVNKLKNSKKNTVLVFIDRRGVYDSEEMCSV